MRNFFTLTIVFLLGFCLFAVAQDKKKTALLKGRVLDSVGKKALVDKRVLLKGLNAFTTTDADGNFEFGEVPYGKQIIEIGGTTLYTVTLEIDVDKELVDIGDVLVKQNDQTQSPTDENADIPTITVNESGVSTEEDGISIQNASGMMTSSRDPLLMAMAFNLGSFWYTPRGAQRLGQEVQVNGIPLNDAETGNASWTQMGGLSDVFRSRDVTYGLKPSNFTFGGPTGSTYFNATAADQKKGEDVSYQSTNRAYRNRVMATLSTGLMANGWAFSFSFSRRWAQQGYVPGTFYDGYAYYAAASKVIGKGQLNLTSFGSPTKRGKSSSATAEVDSLAHTNYFNQYWGYQQGKIRNSNVQNVFQPTTILNYEFRPTERTRWNTAIAYQFGKDKTSGIDGYNYSTDPLGYYYKRLPSYSIYGGPSNYNPAFAAYRRKQLYDDPTLLQIDWDQIYQNNYVDSQTIYNANGVAGKNVRGLESLCLLGNTVTDLNKFTFNTNIEHTVDEHIEVAGGITAVSQSTEFYHEIADLLGGQFYIDKNSFVSNLPGTTSSANWNNLRNQNAILRVGDKYGDDYFIRENALKAWGQAVCKFDRLDFFISASVGSNSFYRDGVFQNGLFSTHSYGKSGTHSFLDYGVKGGITFKIDPRNVLFLNAMTSTTPPTPDNTYVSASTRDYTVQSPTVQTNKSLEAGYMLRSSKLSVRIDGYVNDETNKTKISRFYDDDLYTFVNYAMQGANTRSIGTEWAVEYRLHSHWSLTGVAAIGEVFYANDPNISIYVDNDTTVHPIASKVYIKNYYVGGGFQSAYTMGLNYHPRRFYVGINFNYVDRNYADINPNRMTTAAAGFYAMGSPQYEAIFNQQKLPSAATVDFHIGKTYQLSRRIKSKNKYSKNAAILVNLSVNNILNNTDIVNLGFEQLRYDFTYSNPMKFPNKYIFGEGINYLFNLALRF